MGRQHAPLQVVIRRVPVERLAVGHKNAPHKVLMARGFVEWVAGGAICAPCWRWSPRGVWRMRGGDTKVPPACDNGEGVGGEDGVGAQNDPKQVVLAAGWWNGCGGASSGPPAGDDVDGSGGECHGGPQTDPPTGRCSEEPDREGAGWRQTAPLMVIIKGGR